MTQVDRKRLGPAAQSALAAYINVLQRHHQGDTRADAAAEEHAVRTALQNQGWPRLSADEVDAFLTDAKARA